MAKQFDNNLRGVLFKNDRKESENHPDYKGSCEINGAEFWLSAWIKTGEKGKFMSLSFSAKEVSAPKKQDKPAKAASISDEDLPF